MSQRNFAFYLLAKIGTLKISHNDRIMVIFQTGVVFPGTLPISSRDIFSIFQFLVLTTFSFLDIIVFLISDEPRIL